MESLAGTPPWSGCARALSRRCGKWKRCRRRSGSLRSARLLSGALISPRSVGERLNIDIEMFGNRNEQLGCVGARQQFLATACFGGEPCKQVDRSYRQPPGQEHQCLEGPGAEPRNGDDCRTEAFGVLDVGTGPATGFDERLGRTSRTLGFGEVVARHALAIAENRCELVATVGEGGEGGQAVEAIVGGYRAVCAPTSRRRRGLRSSVFHRRRATRRSHREGRLRTRAAIPDSNAATPRAEARRR